MDSMLSTINYRGKVKEAKIDDRIQHFTNAQLKSLILEGKKLTTVKKRVWKGDHGNFKNRELKGYFKKIDAMKLLNQRIKAKKKNIV
jgi:hypothetical protein